MIDSDNILDGIQGTEKVTRIDWSNGKVTFSQAPANATQIQELVTLELRRRSYPDWRELADAIYWQQNGDVNPMKAYLAKVKAVKDKFPKY